MAGYYHDEDLPRFGEMGKYAPELWKKFSDWYGAAFAEGSLGLTTPQQGADRRQEHRWLDRVSQIPIGTGVETPGTFAG